MPSMDPSAALGLGPPTADTGLVGGMDSGSGGVDADARRLKQALETGDGMTVTSIIRSIVLDVLTEEATPEAPEGGF